MPKNAVKCEPAEQDRKAVQELRSLAKQVKLSVAGGRVRRTSSRFCLGVEHGDYNGTELFGVGTDRFIWLGYRPNEQGRVRLYSGNFPADGVIEFEAGRVEKSDAANLADNWGRFAYGAVYILKREGLELKRGIDGVIFANIPGGGMSRSASLTLNLMLSLLDANDIKIEDKLRICELAQAVENDFIGSPCGLLDQIMILFARADAGTRYNPNTRQVTYVPSGDTSLDFRLVGLDTGTVRPGLEKSTYKVRRAECEKFVALLQEAGYDIGSLADVKDESLYREIIGRFGETQSDMCDRLSYIYEAQNRFYEMIEAWQQGDIETVGKVFRDDGIGLRDKYKISGPELETMCDIARTVPGVLGERMLGGGDKGASGAIVQADSVEKLRLAVDEAYPKKHAAYADKYAVHVCATVDGVAVFDDLI